MKTTTLNEIKNHNPCKSSWTKLLKSLNKTKADNEPLTFITILENLNIQDAVWSLRTLDYKQYCLFSADVAESVIHIYEAKYSNDNRVRKCIKAIRDFHNNKISKQELGRAAAAADAAYADAAAYAADAAADAAYAAYVDAAAYVAYAAAYAADAAYAAAAYAAYAAYTDVAAYADVARMEQWKTTESLFIKHFGESR